jgi:two-component system phosphate regulon sensor histidine kinase PhoR
MVDRIEGSQTVLADPDGLDQIISNLLDNAIRYTPDGGTISIRLSRTEVSARLEIEDTGIGIPAKDLENIFQRFYRVDKARSRALGSTGLGLSIVKHLVQAMNGDIKVRSEVGEGTCFTVVFPLA